MLTEIWSVAYHSSGEVRMDVTVIDAKGIMVSNDISKGTLPLNVTLELSESNWSKKMEFTPIDIENVYLLFGE